MLEVFATSRAVRSFYDTFLETNTLLPKAITIAELEQKALLVPHHVLVDEDMRVLLMQEASRFTQFELLYIDREFFTFLKNSSYLFRFFEELAHEKVALEALESADTYAHYAEHLEVLRTLLQHYKTLLSKHGFFDRITLPERYVVNEAYIRSLGSVRIHLEGFLSRFEVELLSKIATLIPLHVKVTINDYNQKIVELFKEQGITLSTNYTYEIDLSSKEILQAEPLKPQNQEVQVYGFASRFAQMGYVQSCIAQFVEEGLRPEEIVVVLPDEHFSEPLRSFDRWHNLNFAMGLGLKQSDFYQKLSAIEKMIRYDAIEDNLRIERHKIEPELLVMCKELWHKKVSADEAFGVFDTLIAFNAKEQKHPLFQEAFFKFHHFMLKAPALRFEQIVKLLLNRLGSESFDDVRGGKVTVMGVLETRGVAYKGVIVVDFNDEFVPKRSQKDLFLSSDVRAHAGLPTKRDRENLQRYYYHQLFSKAQKIALSYVKNELSMPSRFLDELGFDTTKMAEEKAFYPLFFTPNAPKVAYDVEFIDAPYDLTQAPLSATKLKMLLTCKRQFYFRYLAKLKEAKMPTNAIDELSIGRSLHKVLETSLCDETLFDVKRLRGRIEEALKAENSHEVWRYFVDVWLERLSPFMENEIKRFEEGFRIVKKEFADVLPYNGFVLEGQIDRIDQMNDDLFIIDYKSGKVPTTSARSLESTIDFQLVFYALIASKLGRVKEVYYYDLKEGKLVQENFLEDKKRLLDTILETLKKPLNGYVKCEEIKHCRLCPYVLLCGKEEQI